MKKNRAVIALAVVVALLAAGGWAYAQFVDLAGTVNGCVALAPRARAATPDTGAACLIQGHVGAGVFLTTGVVDNVTGSDYFALQDSVAGGSWANLDSLAVDSVDSKYYELNVRPRRNAAAYRVVFRGSGAAGDTTTAGVILLRVCSTRPC